MHITIEADELEKMSKTALLRELKIWGIHCKSKIKKGTIKEHMKESLSNKVVVVVKEAVPENTKKKNPKFKSMIGRGFVETTYWNILDADEDEIYELENLTFKVPRAPTIG